MLKRRLIFNSWSPMDSKKIFDPHSAMEMLHKKIADDEEFSVLDTGDLTTAVIPVEFEDRSKPVRLQMLALRSAHRLPAKWRPDAPLESIPLLSGEYSADVTHVVLWRDRIAAQEFHTNAPILGRLSFFLRKKLGEQVMFNPLYNPDMFEKLERLRGKLRSVHIVLRSPDYVENAKQSGTFSELVPAVFGTRAPSLNLQISMGRYGPRDSFLDSGIEDAVFEIAESAHEQVDRMVVGGFDPTTGKTERVNLLTERLQIEASLPENDEVTSIPNPDATYASIIEARQTLCDTGGLGRAIEARAMHK